MLDKKVELLAPAGNFSCLKAAISSGANAVYLGGKNFSARAFAGNFDNEEIIEAVKYAHLRNVKIYVTINTLLNEKELENAKKVVEFYYENNVDALLIQDMGLYYWISNTYPDFELHCSTQMHVSNIQAIRNAKKLGFKRVVIPRESSLDFIKTACKEDIEIETFVHGAICVSYSGQCLMSAFSKNRSANKGMCAQCCRLKYELLDENMNKVDTDTDYLLSTKDMCLVNDIPLLIEAGVSSFKIEGRMKSEAYVANVTKMYRKAIDSYYDGINYIANDNEINTIKTIFNRNFTNDYLYEKKDLFNQKSPNHLGVKIGESVAYRNKQLYIKLSSDLNQFDGIRIGEFGCIVNRLYKNGLLVSSANEGDIVSIDVKQNIKGSVYKTLDYKLEKQALVLNDIKLPIDLKLYIYPDLKVSGEIICNGQVFNYNSDISASNALKQPLNKETVFKQFSKMNDTVYYINSFELYSENAFMPISDLNAVRRDLIEKLNYFRLNSFNRIISDRNVEFKELVNEDSDTKLSKYTLSNVINNGVYPDGDILVSEFGGILLENRNKALNYTLNCTNSYSYEFFKKLGFEAIVLSLELKDFEVKDLMDSYKSRTNKEIHPYIHVSGPRNLMYIYAEPFRKYISTDKRFYLSDGINIYAIKKDNGLTVIKDNINGEIKFKKI